MHTLFTLSLRHSHPNLILIILFSLKSGFLGTGKTATFAVGILQRLDPDVKQCQALVLAPTRELAQQIVKVIGALGKLLCEW